MTLQDIQNTLIRGVASIISKEEASVSADEPFHRLGVDSLGFVEILVFIEKNFNLKLIECGLEKKDFETIRALSESVHKRLQP